MDIDYPVTLEANIVTVAVTVSLSVAVTVFISVSVSVSVIVMYPDGVIGITVNTPSSLFESLVLVAAVELVEVELVEVELVEVELIEVELVLVELVLLKLELAVIVTVEPGAVTVTLRVAVACTVIVSSASSDRVERVFAGYIVVVEYSLCDAYTITGTVT
ncbi:uncharacterized protein N7459_004929 [Penicillium hispanicum]|uniref:uncharacterized protein n=1 Tax=Penicillium hispanicum TaxID=1080232 RepID=UPI0025405CA6|nr:uncharacterized protein N7459_004929 [Penicillium hispanicum]KAJ5585129.1 hypothetical protein N7459_004929 [Penicillium hispanicum]